MVAMKLHPICRSVRSPDGWVRGWSWKRVFPRSCLEWASAPFAGNPTRSPGGSQVDLGRELPRSCLEWAITNV
jgi:hypothetical protein